MDEGRKYYEGQNTGETIERKSVVPVYGLGTLTLTQWQEKSPVADTS